MLKRLKHIGQGRHCDEFFFIVWGPKSAVRLVDIANRSENIIL